MNFKIIILIIIIIYNLKHFIILINNHKYNYHITILIKFKNSMLKNKLK